jgi:predicted DNA-binding transcriptional regulator AlpA
MEKLLEINELSRLLGVPVTWIYDRTRHNHPDPLPHYKLGKYLRFSEAEVRIYLNKKAMFMISASIKK